MRVSTDSCAEPLFQSPGFATLDVLTLAMGIGANTAVFSLVDAVLLQSLPYRNTQQLLLLTETLPQLGGADEVGVSAAEYLDYRAANRCFSDIAAYQTSGFNLTGNGTPLRVQAASVSASLFSLLGTSPALGRTFAAGEDREGAGPVAVLSYSLWRDRFGLDANVLGTSVRLDEKPFTIIGVMPANFQFPFDGAPLSDRAAPWVPLIFPADLLTERVREFGVGVVGRLKPVFHRHWRNRTSPGLPKLSCNSIRKAMRAASELKPECTSVSTLSGQRLLHCTSQRKAL